jgi:hypothetical protein
MATTLLWQSPYVNVFKSIRVGEWKKSSKKGKDWYHCSLLPVHPYLSCLLVLLTHTTTTTTPTTTTTQQATPLTK